MSSDRLNVLVTGCSPGGIGYALVKEYHSKGLRVIASARRIEVLAELRALGVDAILLDVTDVAAIRAAKEEVNALTGGKLDILVNNAGKPYSVAATDVTLEEIQSLFMTNLFSVMLLCKEFAPLLIAAKGKIVNIGSTAGIVPFAFGSVYGASKAGLHSYGDALRVEMEPFGVQVITVVTGWVKSNIAQNNKRDIDPGSLYYAMKDQFVAKHGGASQEGAVAAEDYARRVVSQTIRARPRPWLWQGSFAFTVWLTTFLPTGFTDGMVSRWIGLDVFKKRLVEASTARSST